VQIPKLGPPPPQRRRPTLAPLPPDHRLGHGKPLALSWQQLGADRRHHPQQIPAVESQTCRWAWYLVEEAWPWEQRRKKPWQTDDGLRLVGMMIRLKEKGTTLTWGPGLSSDPGSEAIAAPAAAVVAVAVAGAPGVITPRWWWWRQDRRTDAPLRAVGLGDGLLGPTCSPLALLGGSETSDPLVRHNLRRLSSSDPPEIPGAEALLAAPLPLSKGLGPR
jgi:hypothetical protein